MRRFKLQYIKEMLYSFSFFLYIYNIWEKSFHNVWTKVNFEVNEATIIFLFAWICSLYF